MSTGDGDEPVQRPPAARRGFAGRMSAAGMPAEKSSDFKGSTKRLLGRMRPERRAAAPMLGITSVTLA